MIFLKWGCAGALVVGFAGFVLGFVGPVLLAPGANQGPLLGIFITGPLGAVVGLVLGAAFAAKLEERFASKPRPRRKP